MSMLKIKTLKTISMSMSIFQCYNVSLNVQCQFADPYWIPWPLGQKFVKTEILYFKKYLSILKVWIWRVQKPMLNLSS